MSASKPYRILITGSRTWDQEAVIAEAIFEVLEKVGITPGREFVIVHGACPQGADAIAARICQDEASWVDNMGASLVEEPHPADWDAPCRPQCRHAYKIREDRRPYCSAAGLYRNAHMVNLGADVALAFIKGGSPGASHCARLAEKAGIPTRRWTS